MFSYIAIVSMLTILYAYFGYPLVLMAYKKFSPKEKHLGSEPSTFSIIIAARNEKDNIRKKLDDTLNLDWFDGKTIGDVILGTDKIEVIVADDASDDGTSEIVEEYKNKGVKLSRSSARGGKEVAQKKAVGMSKGEVIIFTDTKVSISKDILLRASEHFKDHNVGGLSSIDRVLDESGESGEGAYVKYEMKVRELESEVNTLVGLSGSCFVVRRIVALGMKDSLPSDFYSATECVRQGLSSILANDIVGTYKAVTDPNREFDRKVRTVLRGMSAVLAQPEVFDVQKYGFFTLQVISHKIYRWIVPYAFILLFLSSMVLKSVSSFWSIVFWGQVLIIILATLGYSNPEAKKNLLVKIPLFLVLSNVAIFLASVRLCKGEIVVVWNPSEKG